MTAAHDRSMDTDLSAMEVRDSRTSEVRALAPGRRSLPPRPDASGTKTVRRRAPMLTATKDSRPAPPRPNAVAKRTGPPPLPTACEAESEPAWDASEETDATEWQDVSQYVSVPSLATHSPSFRDGPAVGLAAIARSASTFILTATLFARYVIIDVASFVGRLLPLPRTLIGRMHVQWTRARERARLNALEIRD